MTQTSRSEMMNIHAIIDALDLASTLADEAARYELYSNQVATDLMQRIDYVLARAEEIRDSVSRTNGETLGV